MDNLQIKIPKSLPPYTEDTQIEKLLHAIDIKKTHKRNIVRDILLVELALKTGMRRGELANLEARHIHEDCKSSGKMGLKLIFYFRACYFIRIK